MVFTTPSEINLLGFSGDILSLILETLKTQGFSGRVRIIKNMDVDTGGLFNPGYDLDILNIDQIKTPLDNLFFSVARPRAKKDVFESFSRSFKIQRSKFLTLVHPFTNIASTAVIGPGCYLEPGAIISPYSSLGFGVTINRGATIGHHVIIGDFGTINPGVHIAGHSNIGEVVSIGMGASVLDHVSIGAGSVIGAGSLVTKDIPPGVLAFGNPCKVIRNLE